MEKRDKNISYLRFVITYNIVLLIPLLIVSFSVFYMVHRQHYRKIMDETAVSAGGLFQTADRCYLRLQCGLPLQ